MEAVSDMGVLPYRSPRARDEATASLGMSIFLGSWAMMFGALFLAYGAVRLRSTMWPPTDVPTLPLGMPGIATALLLLSSVVLQQAVRTFRAGNARHASAAIGVGALLGAVFLVLQSIVWRQLWIAGLRPDGGPYASVFYGLTVFHALHVLVGLAALVILWVKSLSGAYSPARFLSVRLWTSYWHFVGVVWMLMFATIYAI